MSVTVVLIEQPLHAHDVERLATFHAPEPATVHLVAATSPEGGRIARALDEAAGAEVPEPIEPENALDSSLSALAAAGVTVDGELAGPDTVAAVVDAVATVGADEVWVVTGLHIVEDALHRGWTHSLRAKLDVPVLHIVSGTDRVLN
jgi:hypothetical protein